MNNVSIEEAMLNKLRQHIADIVAKAQYKVGSTWYDAVFTAEVQSNSMVNVSMILEPVSGPGTVVTNFRLMDSGNVKLAEKTQTITFFSGVDTIMYRFIFGVTVNEGDD